MSKYRLWRIIGAVFVILLQILMCNRIALWGIATPFVVVYLFLKIPSGLKPHFLMTVSFFIGLLIDVFTNTLDFCTIRCWLAYNTETEGKSHLYLRSILWDFGDICFIRLFLLLSFVRCCFAPSRSRSFPHYC